MNQGKCRCAAVQLNLSLPEDINQYSARVCDCDFCTSRNIAYISHPDGLLQVQTQEPLNVDTHGSNQASFLSCKHCNDVVAVVYKNDKESIGAINANLLDDAESMKPVEVVSPKLLSSDDKVARWKTLWMRVNIEH